MPSSSSSIDIYLENGSIVNVPITAKTQVGQVVLEVAHKVSSRPNLQTAGLFHMGSMLPFDLRICALPAGSRLEFHMKLEAPQLQSIDAAINRSMNVDHNMSVLIELPGSKVSRRVVVRRSDPVEVLRETLNISPSLSILYNKRPILDETRSFQSLYISEAHTISFGKVVDNSFVTTTTGHQASLRGVGSVGKQDNTIVLADLSFSKRFQGNSSSNIDVSSSSAGGRASSLSRPPSAGSQRRARGNTSGNGVSFLLQSSDADKYDGRPQNTIKIRVGDPEDEGFIHTIFVYGERKVSSLRQFIADQDGYDIFCDSIQVTDPNATFRQVTGGLDGAVFILRRRSRY